MTDTNTNKIILDLCGGTGSWSKPYKEAGYDVRVITLPEYDVTQVRFENFGMFFGNEYINYQWVYGILAAPPCTEFSKAKGNRYRDFRQGIAVVKACMEIIWEARIAGGLRFWALENPVGFLRQFLGKPNFTFEPYWYGSLHSKRTDVWGYFNIPNKKYDELPPLLKSAWGNGAHAIAMSDPKCPPEYKHLKLNRAALRAITPKEFAQAFYKANL